MIASAISIKSPGLLHPRSGRGVFKPVTHLSGQLCYLSTRSVHLPLPLPASEEREGPATREGEGQPAWLWLKKGARR